MPEWLSAHERAPEQGANSARDAATRPIAHWSTPMLEGRLVALIGEMRVRPLGKNPSLTELAQRVVHELPSIAPDDPRTAEAVEIATFWWNNERSSK
jgi:hypothetical protein